MAKPKCPPKPVVKETLIVRAIITYLKAIRALAWRMPVQASIYSQNGDISFRKSPIVGFPDIACLYKGIFVCFEVKSAKGKLSPHQEVWLMDLQDHGAVARLVRSVEDVQQVLKEIDELLAHEE